MEPLSQLIKYNENKRAKQYLNSLCANSCVSKLRDENHSTLLHICAQYNNEEMGRFVLDWYKNDRKKGIDTEENFVNVQNV